MFSLSGLWSLQWDQVLNWLPLKLEIIQSKDLVQGILKLLALSEMRDSKFCIICQTPSAFPHPLPPKYGTTCFFLLGNILHKGNQTRTQHTYGLDTYKRIGNYNVMQC